MTSIQDANEAFTLATTYNFSPVRPHRYIQNRQPRAGKFEPDLTPLAAERCILLAYTQDHTKILIKYEPANLV